MTAKHHGKLQIKVYAPFKVYFDAPGVSISAANATGPFDILPGHKNFISLLQPCNLVVRRQNENNFELPIERGIIHVRANRVNVFLDV